MASPEQETESEEPKPNWLGALSIIIVGIGLMILPITEVEETLLATLFAVVGSLFGASIGWLARHGAYAARRPQVAVPCILVAIPMTGMRHSPFQFWSSGILGYWTLFLAVVVYYWPVSAKTKY